MKKARHFVFILVLYSSIVVAKDLGNVGETWPIEEEDLLAMIEKRIENIQQNVGQEKLQRQIKETMEKHARRPAPVANVTKATAPKTWLFDASIKLTKDLKDREGHVFAKAGTVFNPLSIVSLKTPLLFFDGDDAAQISWAKKKIKKLNGAAKLVLVNGSVPDIEKTFHQIIYFDQAGKLTSHFHIGHVPAIVEQAGDQLKITEEAI